MKNPTNNLITRESLLATASYNNRWLAGFLAGTSVLGSVAFATNWVGDTDSDWNNNLNWAGDAGNTGNASVNTNPATNPPYRAIISANATQPVVDIFVGSGAATNGRLDHTAGAAASGNNNWTFIGHNGGTGVYNLADTAGTGGTHTGFAQGSGSFTAGAAGVSGRLYIGGQTGSGSNGRLNINTSGTLTVRSQFEIGTNTSVGVVNLDNGTILSGFAGGEDDWFEVGNGGGSTGTLNMSGGSITKGGAQHFIVGANGSTGTMNMSGGTLNVNNEIWVANNGGSNGTLNLSGSGAITNNSWVAIGRNGSVLGTVNQTGGSWTKTNAGTAFIVGASGPGVYNHSGGLVDVQAGDTWMGEANTGTYTLSGTGEFRANVFQVARNGGSTGNVNLNGGTLRANRIVGGGGTENVSFNGTQVIAKANELNFIGGMDAGGATIDAGGLLIDSNGFNLTVPQVLDGTGGIVKSGTGTLTLSGGNSYGGDHTVNAGGLVMNTSGTGTGAINLANGTTFGLNASFAGGQLISNAVSLGGPCTLNLGLGDINGTNPTTSLLDVTGALAVNGAVTVNVSGAKFAVGDIPLISYNAANKTGAGSFSLASLPNGVVANIVVDDNYFGAGLGAVYLDVTSVALPKWTGNLVNRFTTGSPSTLSNDVIVTNAAGIAIGDTVTGPGIDVGTTVTAIAGNTVTLSLTPTADGFDVNLMFSAGPGANPGVWDTTTANWVDQVTGTSSVYADPNPALFDDDAPGLTAVVLNSTVNPSIATFNNSTLTYSLSGTGAISGSGGLVKQGSGDLAVNLANTYDGATRLEGGTLSVATIEDLGTPSPIGDNSQLVIAGGVLNYTGAADTTNRGLTLDGIGGGIGSDVDLTFTGQVLGTGNGSNLRKLGAGNLTFTFGGANTFSSVGGISDVEAGTLILDGTAGGQVNTITGELWVASEPDVPANLTVLNTTLNISSWLAVGRGNGDLGVTNINVTNSTVQTGNFSTGFNNGLGANDSEAFVNLTNSNWTNNGALYLAESPDSTATVTLSNSNWITNTGVTEVSRTANTTTNITISGTSELRVDRFLLGLGDGSVANVIIEDSGKLTKTGGSWMSIGNGGTGQGSITVRDSGTLTNAGGDFNVSDVGTSQGTLNIEDSATVSHAGTFFLSKNAGTSSTLNISGGSLTTNGSFLAGGNDNVANASAVAVINQTGGSVTLNGDDNRTGCTGTATWNVSAGTVTSNGWMTLGRYTGGTGTMNASGGAVTQNHVDRPFRVAEFGTGVLNVSGTATVSAPNAGGFSLAGPAGSSGTINLDGGTLVANRIYAGGADGNSVLVFNGGVLQAATGANLDWVSAGLDSVLVGLGNAIVDTNGQTVAINKAIDDGGGNVTKQGAGTLLLNAASSYLGTTTVTAGTLGGTGSLSGPLQVDASASVNPGASAGTFSVFDSATVDGTYVCEIDGVNADQFAVSGQLTLGAGSVLDFDELSAPAAPVYIIASYGTLSGTFATVNDLPSGYTLDYNYLSGNQIALVQTATPYSTWASSFGLDPNGDGAPGVDKDGDGQVNSVEFALGGSPISGSDNAKVFSLVADSNDGDSANELLMTIAVRTGTGSFGGSPLSLTRDGYTCTIEGSTTLSDFTSPSAVEVGAIAPAAPNATPPAGYEWHTFKLTGSDGLPSRGFLRVLVTP